MSELPSELALLLETAQSAEYALPVRLRALGSLAQSLDKLAQEDEIVVYCRSGARSANAVQFLAGHGYAGAKNLVGGINRWAERIDPSLPRY